jgi:hypothetical protein
VLKKVFSGLVFDMAALEGNSFTYPEVQTLLDGITVGGKKLSEEQQVLNIPKLGKDFLNWLKLINLPSSETLFLNSIHVLPMAKLYTVAGLEMEKSESVGLIILYPPQRNSKDILNRV